MSEKRSERGYYWSFGWDLFPLIIQVSVGNFHKLHSILKPSLEAHFFPWDGGKRDPSKSSYLISTDMIEYLVNVRRVVGLSNRLNKMTYRVSVDQTAVSLDSVGWPSSLLDIILMMLNSTEGALLLVKVTKYPWAEWCKWCKIIIYFVQVFISFSCT